VELDDNGEIILTDIDNRAMAFIRYKNGDIAVPSGGPCSCGRHSPLLTRILGRRGDVVIGVNGNRLHPEVFTHLINESGVSYRRNLRKYQVIQEDVSSLRWLLVCDPISDADRRALIEQLERHLGRMAFAIDTVPDIPASSSGKFQYVVSKIKYCEALCSFIINHYPQS
jgi:phenylacetate-CoA ligase